MCSDVFRHSKTRIQYKSKIEFRQRLILLHENCVFKERIILALLNLTRIDEKRRCIFEYTVMKKKASETLPRTFTRNKTL